MGFYASRSQESGAGIQEKSTVPEKTVKVVEHKLHPSTGSGQALNMETGTPAGSWRHSGV